MSTTSASIIFVFFCLLHLTTTDAIDITSILSRHPDLSDFSALLSATSIPTDLLSRSSITILALPNAILNTTTTTILPSTSLSDILRYHILLELLSWPQILSLSPSGKLVTTLFQTTGRAANDFGSLNITRDPSSGAVRASTPSSSYAPSDATILALIQSIPYNLTILSIDSVLLPTGLGLGQGQSQSQTKPLGLNITDTLIQAHDFNVAASILAASGVAEEFEQDEQGAGISLFIPTDSAFATLSQSSTFQSLPADQKAMVLRFHALHSYYPLGSLQSIVNPVQPTLATEHSGAARFTLNISKVNGSVALNTGIVQGIVSRTVFDQNPVAIFGVSKVLLPSDIFSKDSAMAIEAEPPTDLVHPTLDGDIHELTTSPPAAASSDANTKRSWLWLVLVTLLFLYMIEL